MSKEMIISVNGREKKIAILDNGKVTEFYIERGEENSGIAGNIYKGRVQRVLPGMQSAFVSIGLERDAFLYVTDFFDEEEEIERIVMEKSKKISPEEAKREANDKIDRARLEREKQMDAAQELTEPMAEGSAPIDEVETDSTADVALDTAPDQPDLNSAPDGRNKRGRGRRGRGGRDELPEPASEPGERSAEMRAPIFEIEDSGFERVIDDEETTGEMFKDAYMQERIVDQVRRVEFDMETTSEAAVGSLLGSVIEAPSGFERIADEDDAPAADDAQAKKRKGPAKSSHGKFSKTSKKKKGDSDDESAEAEPAAKAKKKPAAAKATKAKTTRSSKAKKDSDALEDGEASVSAPSEIAEMAVRRGGRGRRRGGRGRRGATDANGEIIEGEENGLEAEDDGNNVDATASDGDVEVVTSELANGGSPEISEPKTEPAEKTESRPSSRGGRGGRGGDRGADRNADRNPERPDRGGERSAERGSERGSERGGEQRGGRDSRDNRGGRNGQGGRGGRDRDRGPQPTISELLREGQEILVQIAKEPIARKGARITSHIALPGRFLVYMPTIEHLGVSRKIESASERGRLRTLIQKIKQDEDVPSGGFIVRTAGVGIADEDLRQDARYLVRTWQDIKKTSEKAKSPAMVHQDLDLVQRLLRDHLSEDFTAIRVDSEEEYLRTVEFINRMQPRMVNRVKFYTRDEPILDAYGVQEEIDKALKPRVWLKSGGYLVINQTEALVAIDVNTGKFVGKGNARLEDTITKTNMEAVDEIARQIRLRDLGGIIVLDLIDMEDRRNRHKVSQALQEALQSDKSPTKVLSFNDFGLIIMTRKRVKQSLERTMCAPCDYCEGAGWVKSPTTICYEILSEARRLGKHLDDVRQTTLRIHPDVAKALRNSERSVLEEIEAYLGNVDLSSDPTIHQAQFDFAFI
jgi:ribonuclease G